MAYMYLWACSFPSCLFTMLWLISGGEMISSPNLWYFTSFGYLPNINYEYFSWLIKYIFKFISPCVIFYLAPLKILTATCKIDEQDNILKFLLMILISFLTFGKPVEQRQVPVLGRSLVFRGSRRTFSML